MSLSPRRLVIWEGLGVAKQLCLCNEHSNGSYHLWLLHAPPPLSPLPPCLPSPLVSPPPLSPLPPCLPSPLVFPPPCLPSPLVSPPPCLPSPLSPLPLCLPSPFVSPPPLSPLPLVSPPCLPSPLISPPPLSPLPPCLCQVLDKFTSLPHIFSAFRQCLVDSDGMLKKHKEKFRTGLLQDAEDFKRTVNDLVETFESSGPFTSEATQEQVRRWEAELSAAAMSLSLTVPLVLPSHFPPSLHNYSYSPIPCLSPLPLPAPSCPLFLPCPAPPLCCPAPRP